MLGFFAINVLHGLLQHIATHPFCVVIVRGLKNPGGLIKGRWGVGVRVHKGTQIPLRFLRGKTFSTF